MLFPMNLCALLTASQLLSLPAGLMAQLPAAVPDQQVDPALEKKVEPEMTVDLGLIRRAVIGKLISAREGKQAIEFDRLRRAKQEESLGERELGARLEQIGLSWAEGGYLDRVALNQKCFLPSKDLIL